MLAQEPLSSMMTHKQPLEIGRGKAMDVLPARLAIMTLTTTRQLPATMTLRRVLQQMGLMKVTPATASS